MYNYLLIGHTLYNRGFMSKFWELFRESVIVQAFVTLLFSVTLCYLWIREMSVPGELYALTGIVYGYWFKSKAVYSERKNLDSIERIVNARE